MLSTLEGEMLLGDPDACITSGRIFIGTSPEIMDGAVNPGDIVLVSNRYEVQMCAIDCGAGAIVVCAALLCRVPFWPAHRKKVHCHYHPV